MTLRRDIQDRRSPRPPRVGAALAALAAAVALASCAAALATPAGRGLRARLAVETVPRLEEGLRLSGRALHVDVLQAEALDALIGGVALLLLAGWGVALVTLAACLASEGAELRRPTAVRASLGADPLRLVRERAVGRLLPLAIAGLLLGAPVGVAAAWLLHVTWPGGGSSPVPLVGAALAAPLLLASLLTLALSALAPVRQGFRDLPATLGAGGRATPDRGEGALRRLAVGIQLAVSLVLLSSASLTLPSSLPRGAVAGEGTPGSVVLLLPFEAPPAEARTERALRYETLLERVRLIPDVRAESIASPGAWSDLGTVDFVLADCGRCIRGALPVPWLGEEARHHLVTSGFFAQAGLAPHAGRSLETTDAPGAAPVAVVSRSFALSNFEGGDAVGRHLRVTPHPSGWHEVVGVVEDRSVAVPGRGAGRQPAVYLSALQHPPERGELAVLVPEGSDVEADLAAALEAAGLVPAGAPETLAARVRRQEAPLVWAGRATGLAALGALLLALLGAGGAASLEVSARRRELAVRAAIGATPARLRLLVVRRAAGLALLSALVALPVTMGVGARLRHVSGEVPLFQPATYLLLTVLLAAAALTAALSGARDAARTPPAEAMAND